MFVITEALLAVGATLIASGMLPEERARDFRSLMDDSTATGMKIKKEPIVEDNPFIW